MTVCPECAQPFTPARKGQVFCDTPCRNRFYDRMGQRGKMALPFLLTWRKGKRGASEASTYAFAQLCALADAWNAEDAKAGRNTLKMVENKMESAWRAVDAA